MGAEMKEYRVVGVEAAFGRRFVNENSTSLEGAKRMAQHFRDLGDRNVLIECRTVSHWERVKEEADDV